MNDRRPKFHGFVLSFRYLLASVCHPWHVLKKRCVRADGTWAWETVGCKKKKEKNSSRSTHAHRWCRRLCMWYTWWALNRMVGWDLLVWAGGQCERIFFPSGLDLVGTVCFILFCWGGEAGKSAQHLNMVHFTRASGMSSMRWRRSFTPSMTRRYSAGGILSGVTQEHFSCDLVDSILFRHPFTSSFFFSPRPS